MILGFVFSSVFNLCLYCKLGTLIGRNVICATFLLKMPRMFLKHKTVEHMSQSDVYRYKSTVTFYCPTGCLALHHKPRLFQWNTIQSNKQNVAIREMHRKEIVPVELVLVKLDGTTHCTGMPCKDTSTKIRLSCPSPLPGSPSMGTPNIRMGTPNTQCPTPNILSHFLHWKETWRSVLDCQTKKCITKWTSFTHWITKKIGPFHLNVKKLYLWLVFKGKSFIVEFFSEVS